MFGTPSVNREINLRPAPEVRSAIHAIPDEHLPKSDLSPRTVASRLVDALVERGVDTFFGVPGGPICAFFEALRLDSRARLVESRHETHAAFAATAYYRSTGRVAGVIVTAGPGITNAVTGIASAFGEGVPLLVIAGDVAWNTAGKRLAQASGPGGFHAEGLLGPVTRAAVRVGSPIGAVAQCLDALDRATDPNLPGPALVVLPIDIAMAETQSASVVSAGRFYASPAPTDAVRTAATWLCEAERPLIVLGGGARAHADAVRALVDLLDVPFVTTPRAKGVVSELHPRSLRNGGMAASSWARAYTALGVDATLVLGSDLDDTSVGTTPYVGEGGRLVHVDRDASVFHRNHRAALAVRADVGAFVEALTQLASTEGLRNGRCRAALASVKATAPVSSLPESGTSIAPHRAVLSLQSAFPSALFTTDIGEHMLFALHYLTAQKPSDFAIQLNLGSMGSGIAGAIGHALGSNGRKVVCIAGDGCMQMAGMELLVAIREALPIVFAVFNDGRYNMVHHGMRQIFGDASEWSSPGVDFVAYAGAIGMPAMRIDAPSDFDSPELAALSLAGGPVLLDIRIDPSIRLPGAGRVESLSRMSMREVKS